MTRSRVTGRGEISRRQVLARASGLGLALFVGLTAGYIFSWFAVLVSMVAGVLFARRHWREQDPVQGTWIADDAHAALVHELRAERWSRYSYAYTTTSGMLLGGLLS